MCSSMLWGYAYDQPGLTCAGAFHLSLCNDCTDAAVVQPPGLQRVQTGNSAHSVQDYRWQRRGVLRLCDLHMTYRCGW